MKFYNISEVSEYTDYEEPDNIGQDISCNLGSLNIKMS
ncbi:hypothetical protein CoNPh17_CDS0041 [Staphylococcus phage S-CoN_Ph17]|nr:hypothetical protein CoNPh17_CDS0041 [Staphylococcus phage S-CoN_Ph17]